MLFQTRKPDDLQYFTWVRADELHPDHTIECNKRLHVLCNFLGPTLFALLGSPIIQCSGIWCCSSGFSSLTGSVKPDGIHSEPRLRNPDSRNPSQKLVLPSVHLNPAFLIISDD